jgi:hypothetical protein
MVGRTHLLVRKQRRRDGVQLPDLLWDELRCVWRRASDPTAAGAASARQQALATELCRRGGAGAGVVGVEVVGVQQPIGEGDDLHRDERLP